MKLVGIAISAGAVLAASPALAQTQLPSERAPREATAEPARSYGTHIAIADASSIALVGASTLAFAAGARTKALGWPTMAAAGGYTFAAPIMHWSRGRVGVGFASLGLRVAAPLIATGAYFGTYHAVEAGRGGNCTGHGDVSEEHCEPAAALVAIPVGVLSIAAVTIFDAMVLAKEPARAGGQSPSASSARGALGTLAPSLEISAGRTALGMTGTF